MNILSDDEVLSRIGGGAKRILSDEEVMGATAPTANSPKRILSDEEVMGGGTAPAPSAAPVPMGQEGGVTPIARPPLPRVRPSAAPPPSAVMSTQEMPPVQGLDLPPEKGILPALGESVQRGFHKLRQSGSGAIVGGEARALNNLTEIERRIAAGESPDAIKDSDDLFGARFMTPEQRTSLRAEMTGNIASAAGDIAARQADIKALPTDPDVERASNAKTWDEFWTAFKEHPLKFIAHTGAESLAPSGAAMVGGGVAGLARAGLGAATVATGAGSYGVDYMSNVLDAIRESGVDLNDPAAVAKAVSDPAFLEKIGKKAHAHAVGVGLLDAASMRVAGASMLPKSVRPGNVVAEKLAEIPIQAPVQGALGAAGEVLGGELSGETAKPGAIAGEFFGEFATAPVDVATATMAKGTSGTVPVPPTDTIGGDELTRQIAAAGDIGLVAPTGAITYPPPTTPPPPASEAVELEPGVETLTKVTPGIGVTEAQAATTSVAAGPESRVPRRADDGQIQSYAHVTEDVPIAWLRQLPGNELRNTPEEQAALAADIEARGIDSPLIVTVGKSSRTAKLGEGNHRLAALEALGYTHAPVRVIVGSNYGKEKGEAANRDADIVPVDGTYFPSDSRPSNVFRSLAASQTPVETSTISPKAIGVSRPVEGLYSRLAGWVVRDAPQRATAQRWIAQLQRSDFTQEEVRDSKLLEYLRSVSPRERLSKEDILARLEANAITLHEIVRKPMSDEKRTALEFEIIKRMTAVARADPSALRPGAGGMGVESFYEKHPAITPLMDAWKRLNDPSNWTKYEQYTTPGPREGYIELTVHTPTRLSDTVLPPPEPTGNVVYDPDGDSAFPWQINVNGREWNRMRGNEATARAELEDALSTIRARRSNQKPKEFVGGHYQVPGELFTMRVTMRRTIDGQPMALLEEIQGDIAQKAKTVGVGNLTPGSLGYIPDLPLKEGWAELGFNRFLMWAVENDIRHVAWADSVEQMRRYPQGTPGEVQRRAKGMSAFYGRQLEGFARKWKRLVGATLSYTTIPGPEYVALPLDELAESTGWESTETPGKWGVFDVNNPNQRPIIVTQTQADAEAYVARNTDDPVRFRSLEFPHTGIEYIKAGMPTHAKEARDPQPGGNTVTMVAAANVNPLTVKAMEPIRLALEKLVQHANVGVPITIQVFGGTLKTTAYWQSGPNAGQPYQKNQPGFAGVMETFTIGGKTSRYTISVALGHHKTPEGVWSTITHEFGHVMDQVFYARAPLATRIAVDAAFDKWLQSLGPNPTLGQLRISRDSFINLFGPNALFNPNSPTTMDQLSKKEKLYHMSKSEWFAESVARWATTNMKPLSVVDKFFAGLGRKILKMLEEASKLFGQTFSAPKALEDWLNDQTTGEFMSQFMADLAAETGNQGTTGNAPPMGPEETPAPAQPDTGAAAGGIGTIFNGNPPPEVGEARAYADKFNWLYKWSLAIQHVATRNPAIRSLQEYVETLSVAAMIKNRIMVRAQEVLKKWNKLGERQADAVSTMLDDVQHMVYRTAAEIQNKVARLPTLQELQDIAQRRGVTSRGFAVFLEITKTFQEHLQRVEAMLRAEANKITDETKRGLANAAIDKQMEGLRKKPYFPAMRFGDFTITIRDAAGKVVHFETFENKRTRDRAADAIQTKYGVRPITPGDPKRVGMQLGKLNKQARPLLGVPTQLLDLMGKKLNMSSVQRDALEQLKFELSPAQSFQHRFQHKKLVAGYSQDFRRAYATYFFHGANHIVKAQFADRLRELANITEEETKINQYDVTKRSDIVAYIRDHTQEWLDPKSDWAQLRSVAFLWYLAWSPAAAMQNLTQTLTTSYPFLASQFGDFKSVAALANAGRQLETWYKKGTMDITQGMQRALWRGMEDGIIKETQAPELAGYADGDVLGKGFGGNALQRGLVKFNEMGAKMFELAEQVNRRLIFRAAYQLALDNPNTKYVRDMLVKHKLTYDQLRAEGWPENEATAYVVARDATIETQFQYGREYAPRMFRGKARTLFVFKTFILNYVLFLGNYPKAAIRSLIILAYLGGFMGLPGADDLKGILKMLAWRLPMFEKDFDLEQEARRLIIQLLGDDENGRQNAELLMHGVARKGFGIPGIMDMLGGTAGVDIPMPTFDRAAAISAGSLLPIDFGALFGPPSKNTDAVIARQAEKASGAVFGVGWAVTRALMNHQLDIADMKRWERVVPRSIASVSKAWSAYDQGESKRADGSQLVQYDVRDTQQMAEVIGMGLGYTPYRQTLQRERDQANMDATNLWEIRRQDLMRHFGNAVLGKDPGEVDKVLETITKFNDGLPPSAAGKAITRESLKDSVDTRAKGRALREEELSVKKSDIPIMDEVGRLYPESQRVLRKVKPSLTP